MDGGMDGGMDGWMDGWMDNELSSCCLTLGGSVDNPSNDPAGSFCNFSCILPQSLTPFAG